MKIPAVTILIFLVWALNAIGEDRQIPEMKLITDAHASNVQIKVQAEYDAGVKDLNQKYKAALARALEVAQDGGKLEDALALKAEIARIDSEDEPAGSETPAAQLKNLRNIYEVGLARLERERAGRIAPLNRKLADDLEHLVVSLTKVGRLEDAVVVKQKWTGILAEAAAGVESKPTADDPAHTDPDDDSADLLTWLQRYELYWNGTNASELVIQVTENLVSVYADDNQIIESEIKVLSDSSFQFEWSKGDLHTFTIARDKDSFVRKLQSSGGGHDGRIRRRSR
ncbi:MAG: hypothetical protein ACI8UO_004326 [Verrucomicrobiales bacterium]|jgi:hypothetical protein